MDGITIPKALGFLRSHCMAILAGLMIIMKEGLSLLWRNLTFQNIISTSIFIYFIRECGSQEDIDSFFSFFHNLFYFLYTVYLFSLTHLFIDILTSLGILCLIYHALYIRSSKFRRLSWQIHILGRGLHKAVLEMREFFFAGDDDEKPAAKEGGGKKGLRLGAPRSLRLDERSQFTPPVTPTTPTGSMHQRSGSEGLVAGSRRGKKRGRR